VRLIEEVVDGHHLQQRESYLLTIIEMIWWTGLAPGEFEFRARRLLTITTCSKKAVD